MKEVTMKYALSIAAILGALSAASPAAAEFTLRAEDLRGAFPGLVAKPSPNRGWIVFETWREPEVQLGPNAIRLRMSWNGLDDDQWPFTRILDGLVGRACGPVLRGWAERQVARLDATRSLTRERDLGGNGGTTFSKRLAVRTGGCEVVLRSQGARWSSLEATLSPASGRR